MPTPEALCILTDLTSKDYIKFQGSLQKVSGQVKVINLSNVSKKKGDSSGNEFHNKLNNVIDNCQAILVICSETLKYYLDENRQSNCPLLNTAEREVILRGFQNYPKKVILVALPEEAKMHVPRDLLGNEKPLNGESDLATIDAKIKALR